MLLIASRYSLYPEQTISLPDNVCKYCQGNTEYKSKAGLKTGSRSADFMWRDYITLCVCMWDTLVRKACVSSLLCLSLWLCRGRWWRWSDPGLGVPAARCGSALCVCGQSCGPNMAVARCRVTVLLPNCWRGGMCVCMLRQTGVWLVCAVPFCCNYYHTPHLLIMYQNLVGCLRIGTPLRHHLCSRDANAAPKGRQRNCVTF